ncbi:hypothetical protein C5L39_06085 [Corynebacterium alimapuense]|uniref:Bacterial mobilisation domain-containing protein n=2 Tax=Corynebacterium alimapuense TaxID=1576874 RepID=A0A3M8K6L7_9CORY|nr:hypothetical protein C5L39_06085 [Corynebacterium alimapuense]
MQLEGPVKKRLTLRLDSEQWNVVSEVAKRVNLTPAEVMRGAIHTLSDRLPRGWSERINDPPESFQNDVRRLWKEINQIGVNINQLTRLAHRSNDAELKEIMSQTEAALRGLRREVTAVVNHHC